MNQATTEARVQVPDELMFTLLKEHLGLEKRRDDTVINRTTGRWTDAQRYRNLLNAALRAELGKDAERLDWMMTGGTLIQSANTQKWRYFGDPSLTYYATKREAIDAAIEQSKEQS